MRFVFHARPLLRLALALTLSFGAATTALAQKNANFKKWAKVGDPKFDSIPSPQVNIGVNKKFKPKDWLEIEVPFKVTKALPKPEDDYLDSIQVQWFIVVKGQDNKAYRMEKTIKHVNIPLGEDLVTSVYLSPNTLKRITGKDNAGKNDLEAVGGEISLNGTMIGFFSHGLKDGWWRKEIKSVTVTQKFPLLNKNETPFKPYWHDRYAEIAEEKN